VASDIHQALGFGGFGDRRGTGVITLGDLVLEYLLPSNASHRTAQASESSTPGGPNTGGPKAAPEPPPVPVAYMSQHALFHQAGLVDTAS